MLQSTLRTLRQKFERSILIEIKNTKRVRSGGSLEDISYIQMWHSMEWTVKQNSFTCHRV
jgi:hypothetical protein